MAIKKVNHRLGANIFFFLLLTIVVGGAVSLIAFQNRLYWMAFVGAFVYTAGKFSWKKNKFDRANKEFNYHKFMDHEWDNLCMSIGGILLFTDYMYDLTGLFSDHVKEVKFYEVYYYLPGPLGDRVYNLISFVYGRVTGTDFKNNYTVDKEIGDAEDSPPEQEKPTDEVL